MKEILEFTSAILKMLSESPLEKREKLAALRAAKQIFSTEPDARI